MLVGSTHIMFNNSLFKQSDQHLISMSYTICIDLFRIRIVRPSEYFSSTIQFKNLNCLQLNLISRLLDYRNNHGFPTGNLFLSYSVLLYILLSSPHLSIRIMANREESFE